MVRASAMLINMEIIFDCGLQGAQYSIGILPNALLWILLDDAIAIDRASTLQGER